MTIPRQRRTDIERNVVGGFDDGCHRYYDQVAEKTVIKIISGAYYVTDVPDEVIITILGSCVSACMRDPVIGVGGMNHFLLPDSKGDDANSMRFGSFAMEQLINELLKRGARKERLEVKVFGGGNVIKSMTGIGSRNAQFVREFLATEEIPIVAEDLEGPFPRRIHYFPDTGKVRVRKLQRREDMDVADKEINFLHTLEKKTTSSGDVELFD